MGLTKKSKKDKKAEKAAADGEAAPEGTVETPALSRPGTSGTELGLRESHQQARSAFQRAQRAEQTYRIRKQATAARTDKEAAVAHFKNSWQEFRKACRSTLRCLRLMPAVAREKNQARQQKQELKQIEREEERRKRLSAEIKKVEEKKKKMGNGVEPAPAPEAEA